MLATGRCWSGCPLAKPDRIGPRGAARHHSAVASLRISGLLALEISRPTRETQGKPGITRSHPADEQRQPVMGAPRIHGELLKLGFELAESTVSEYMVKHRGPPSQTWRTFLRNHADAIAAIDLCVVPTLTFGCPLRSCEPWSTTAVVVRGNHASDGGVASAAARGGISVGHGTAVSDQGQ